MNLQNFAQLCMTPAPLGNEHATINLIRQTIPEGFAIRTDPAGSIIVQKPGQKPGLMIFASLSEPTILITGKRADGSWKGKLLGTGEKLEALDGWEISDGRGAYAKIHVKDGELYFAEEKNITVGSTLTQRPVWNQDGEKIFCKGIGDRAGCWLLMELLHHIPEIDREITCVFLAQERLNPRVAELAANETGAAVAIRIGCAPVNNRDMTGVAVQFGQGPAIKLRERYASTDGRLLEFLRELCCERKIPHQYELAELSITGLYTAQYGGCGVVISGIDIPEDKGCILLSDLEYTENLIQELIKNADKLSGVLSSLPAVRS